MFESEIESTTLAADAVCQSNAFYIVKPTPLSELELLYACFCRTHGLEMEVRNLLSRITRSVNMRAMREITATGCSAVGPFVNLLL